EPSGSTTESSESIIPSSPSGTGTLPSTGQGTPSNRSLLPQTGEQVVYMFLSGLLLVLISLFFLKKRREEELE
ncbi:LPXTG cell wall anchor domain-containing protein, partial [Enterococcus sp. 669A]